LFNKNIMKIDNYKVNKPHKPQMNVLDIIRSRIKNMDYATKFDYFFLKPCGFVFLSLLILKITAIITVSWWIVFTPIIIPTLVLWWVLSKNAG